MSAVVNSRPQEGAKLGSSLAPTPDPHPGLTTHESVYRVLRERILIGGFPPGRAVTLRGLADELGTSAMPVREAVRRLIAERALTMRDNRRVLVPEMTKAKFNQVVFARQMLEPELAARALRNMTANEIKTVASFDQSVDRAMAKGDVEGYMRGNFDFHFGIYRLARNDMLLGLVESIWLQFGPFMRMAYGHFDTSQLEDFHQAAVKAMKAGDETALRAAIAADIGQGMNFIGEEVLANVEAAKAATGGTAPIVGSADAPS